MNKDMKWEVLTKICQAANSGDQEGIKELFYRYKSEGMDSTIVDALLTGIEITRKAIENDRSFYRDLFDFINSNEVILATLGFRLSIRLSLIEVVLNESQGS